jgi:hypothetical protein
MTGPHSTEKQLPNGPVRREHGSPEAGYAYIMALFLMLAVIISSQVVMQNLATQGRRRREENTIWRGNQWARAIRLYYHKTGHYPQSIDDLETGVPDYHFLRSAAIKDPMDTDGTWRFIYVNSTGQIIGSVRYATLQQMALMDLNGGQLPAIQPNGLPGGVPAASLSSTFSDNSNDNAANSGNSSGSPGGAAAAGAGAGPGGSSSVGGTNGNAESPQGTSSPGDSSSQTPSGSTDNSAGPAASQSSQNSNSSTTSPFGQGQSASTFGSSGSSAFGQNANPLAQLQPTGPVDGPVVGAFLTGVGIPVAVDQSSVKIYHGAKKYKDWEFIWNPLEDQAQAIQQGLGTQGQSAQPGQTTGSSAFGTSPFGTSTGTGSMGSTSPQSSTPQPQPNQQSPP